MSTAIETPLFIFSPPIFCQPLPTHRRFEILRSMGIMWNEPLLVDWRDEEEHLIYPWREWGVVKRGPEDDDDDIGEIAIDPEFGLDASSSLM